MLLLELPEVGNDSETENIPFPLPSCPCMVERVLPASCNAPSPINWKHVPLCVRVDFFFKEHICVDEEKII